MEHQTYQHFLRLDIAREALELGARRSVVQQMTGISESELRHVFGLCPGLTGNHGGRPTSIEKLFEGREIHLQASDFYSGFHHLFHRGVQPDQALVVAYRRYQHRHAGNVRLGFDRAFSVVTSVCRLWTTSEPSLRALRCGHCGALFIAPVDTYPWHQTPCTYCRVARRPGRLARTTVVSEPPVEDSSAAVGVPSESEGYQRRCSAQAVDGR